MKENTENPMENQENPTENGQKPWENQGGYIEETKNEESETKELQFGKRIPKNPKP